jgi:hypothetical protein
MKCDWCPKNVSKLREVEVANTTGYYYVWICNACYKESGALVKKCKDFVGYVRETGRVRYEHSGDTDNRLPSKE